MMSRLKENHPAGSLPTGFEERISALLDDETTSFETRRTLDELSRNPAARQRLADLGAVRAVTQAALTASRQATETRANRPSVSMLADAGFADRLQAALDVEAEKPVVSSSRWTTRLAGGGVAAAVALVAVGVWTQVEGPGGSPSVIAPTAMAPTEMVSPERPAEPMRSLADQGSSHDATASGEADIEAQRRFAGLLSNEALSSEWAEGRPIRFFESGLTPWSSGGSFSLASPFADALTHPRWTPAGSGFSEGSSILGGHEVPNQAGPREDTVDRGQADRPAESGAR